MFDNLDEATERSAADREVKRSLGDAVASIAELAAKIDRLQRDMDHSVDKVNAILDVLEIEAPEITRMKQHLKIHLLQLKKIHEKQKRAFDVDEYYDLLSVHSNVVATGVITKQELQAWYEEADTSTLRGWWE